MDQIQRMILVIVVLQVLIRKILIYLVKAWVTEIGVDLNDKINLSVQAAPNRKDIPPKGNITFQMNPNVGLLGSFDKNGNWQSQLQLYFRY